MMRTLVAASIAIAALATPTVDAQQMAGHPPPPGYPAAGAPYGHQAPTGGRWGSKVDGRWWGGANAPGGWRAYRRPYRGWTLPSYWVSPRFYISDWNSYGLSQPPAGYAWSRYYDDAVLIDDRGSIYDTVGGVDWDGYDGYQGGYGGGTAGYAVDRPAGHDHHGRVPVAPAYPPPPPVYAPAPPPPPPPPPPAPGWTSPDGGVTVVTSGSYYGGTTTVVTVQTPPVITTTVTDIYEDHVTYRAPVRRRVVRRHVWHPRCGCR